MLINWLAKEEDPNTGEKLWENPYRILKIRERFPKQHPDKPDGDNFCLRKWKEEEIISKVDMIQEIHGFAMLIPTESAYNLQSVLSLDHSTAYTLQGIKSII